MSTSGSNSEIVLQLAEEFLERCRQGQRPSLKDYIDRHPALADEIREVFPAMAMMENIALADESLAGDPQSASRSAAEAPLEQLGDGAQGSGEELNPLLKLWAVLLVLHNDLIELSSEAVWSFYGGPGCSGLAIAKQVL
jgi:hypothetical protein